MTLAAWLNRISLLVGDESLTTAAASRCILYERWEQRAYPDDRTTAWTSPFTYKRLRTRSEHRIQYVGSAETLTELQFRPVV